MSEFVRAKLEMGETAATIAAMGEHIEAAVEAIKSARAEIERQIRRDRFFLTTLEPYEPPEDAGRVVSRMCSASLKAGVGPMATVAGVIAQEAMEAMVAHGCTHGWVDNGGDVALVLDRPATIEVFSEPGSRTAFALELGPTEGIIGVCTSSGKLGHSISFGDADVAVAIAKDAVLADALATAMGNRVRDSASLKSCFDGIGDIDGFIGGLVMFEGAVAMRGAVPGLTEVEHNPDRLTVHPKMAGPEYTGAANECQEVRP
jgi:ApbE superfamily uncharacterized protein (UPF0280 family)